MFSDELKSLLVKVIKSWQVLAATGVLVLYFFLVNYVSSLRRRKRPEELPKLRKKRGQAAAMEAPVDDDLGLEEKNDGDKTG